MMASGVLLDPARDRLRRAARPVALRDDVEHLARRGPAAVARDLGQSRRKGREQPLELRVGKQPGVVHPRVVARDLAPRRGGLEPATVEPALGRLDERAVLPWCASSTIARRRARSCRDHLGGGRLGGPASAAQPAELGAVAVDQIQPGRPGDDPASTQAGRSDRSTSLIPSAAEADAPADQHRQPDPSEQATRMRRRPARTGPRTAGSITPAATTT